MSTSLSEQLKRLAVPQTGLLLRDKKRPSLLFDPKEAAGLKRETVYQIGLDGLEELITKNQDFEPFKNSLFHFTSKKFERAVETADSNRRLDRVIRKFLLHLSPYFLLNCAHKALEWLINRYSIHEYNREDLLMLIMPYHESNVFVRVVQLMKFRDHNDSWFFLKSLQKTGVHLTKQNLLNHAASDVYFLKFVGKFITLLVKQFEKPNLLTVAFNFYCTVYTGAIEYSEINEAQITQMLPTMIKGLNSDIPDYCAASYIILGRLVLKTPMTDVVLAKFVEKISEAKVESLKTETVLILLVLYQSQTHYVDVPEEACANIVKMQWLPKVLQELSIGKCYITPFLKALVRGCLYGVVKLDKEEHREFMKSLLAAIKFEDDFMETFLSILLDGTKAKKPHPPHVQKWLVEIIETLERQYPDQFDKEVYKILSTTKQGKVITRRQSLQKILKATMTVRCKFDVLDKLYHPNPTFRTEAIRYLTRNYEKLREREKEMIKSSFIDRLNDDDVGVVSEALALIGNVSVFKAATLKDVLIKLAYKCQRDLKNWGTVSTDVVLMLCANSDPNDWETFVAVFPYLLPNTEEQLEASRKLSQVSFVRKNPLLRKINGKLDDCERFCNKSFDSLKNDDMKLVEDFIRKIKETPLEQRNVLNKYLITLILSCILPNGSPIETNVSIVDIFIKFLENCEIRYEKGNAFFQKHIAAARSGLFHIEAFLLCLKNVILKTRKPEVGLGRVDFHADNALSKYFVSLANALFGNSPNHKKYVQFFVNYFCEDLSSKIEFVLNLGICGKCTNPEFPLQCANIVARLLEHAAAEDQALNELLEGDVFLPYVLAMLQQKSEEIRRESFKIVRILSKFENADILFRELMDQREEIIADNDQMPLIMFNHLSPSTVKDRKILKNAENLKNMLIRASCKEDYPIYLKAKMLELLSHINTVEVFEETAKDCLGFFESGSSGLNEVESVIVVRNLMRYQAGIAKDIKLDSSVWKLVETCLKRDDLTIVHDNNKFASVVLLKQFDKEFLGRLEEEVEAKLLGLIVEIATFTKNPEILPAVRHLIKIIDLNAKLIVPHFVAMRDVQSPKLDPNKLKRRISVVPTIDILDTAEWKKGLTALEFIQNKKKIKSVDILLPVLFEILKKCLDFDEQAAVEYPKQLILSSILELGTKTDEERLSETAFNIELIVQCIRASQNPQTHYYALLVLAFSARMFPSQVLHNVMAIFTFMGSSVLRYEDAYSFQIIAKIIDTIVPILVKDGGAEAIAKVLRVFVDVLLDVPEHRRMPIYGQLLSKIGVSDNLYIFLLLIFESHVNHSSTGSKKEDDMKRLEIAANICREFPPKVVLENCILLTKYLEKLPDEVDTDNAKSAFDIHFKTPKQFRHYKYTLIMFIARLLSSKEFVIQVASLNSEDLTDLEVFYKDVIVNILNYIHRISKVAEKNSATQHAKYWKVILHLSYDILDSVNALLTPQMFLLVIKSLMSHNFNTIKRRSMELLNTKLQTSCDFFDGCSKEEIYSLVPPLIDIIKNVEEAQAESEEELIVQTALLSLKLLVKLLVAEHREKFVEILDFMTDLIKSARARNNVLASVLLCLAELCAHLRAHAIPSLPNFMPALLKILKQQKTQESSSLLLLSSITAVQKILDTLPLFLSPYLEKLLFELSVLASRWGEEANDAKLQPVVNKLSIVRQQIGRSVPSRVLIPALERSYDHLISKNAYGAIGFLLEVLAENLNHLTGAEINANLPELTAFFLGALQFRSDQETSFEVANEVESQIVKALTKLILKLSESTFKPLYYKLFDWAVRHEVKTERLVSFYALSSGIAESLKSLFVLFAGHFLSNAAEILDACNAAKAEGLYFEDERKNVLLLENVLKTLRAVFVYDNHKFINKDRFQVLMQPLVDQLENALGGVESLAKRNEELVTPAVVYFAVATGDDSLWKQLNYQILLKMKHGSASIRMISLHCLKEMVKKLGVDYLPLLPETIPVLAELLEDEEETVEKACRRAVQEMEKILGEPIEKYFKM